MHFDIDMGTFWRVGAVAMPTLLAIAGVWVAVEVPKVEKTSTKWMIRIGLIVFGLITSGFVYLQQDYDRRESEKAQKSAIESFKASERAALQEVEGKVQKLSGPSVTESSRPRHAPSPTAAAEPKHARIHVTSIEFGTTKEHPGSNPFVFNFYIKNDGSINGDSPYKFAYTNVYPGELSHDETRATVEKVVNLAISKGYQLSDDRSQIYPSQELFFSVYRTLSNEQIALVKDHKAWVYFIGVVTYSDPNTKGGYWVSEYCEAIQPDGTMLYCGIGNRTWFRKTN